MVSSVSSAVSLVSSAAGSTSSSSTGKLVKLGNGEYTASSVQSDPIDAAKLGLTREKDGNYGTANPATATVSSTSSAATRSTAAVQSALSTLTLGGS